MHIDQLRVCRSCPKMNPPVVSGGPVVSRIVLVGQAPGDKEPKLGKPFAWTAGKTLFRWFKEGTGLDEEYFRGLVYMAAVCRCFPGKKLTGGDREPSLEEIQNCSKWLKREMEILRPSLVIPVGKLAISQFLQFGKLVDVVGKKFKATYAGYSFDVIPLAHPSGASPWHSTEPGKGLTYQALKLIKQHPVFKEFKDIQ
ncbi:MAG: uracil-DNA glycosylase family protein [Candidatus Omnitrophota bacterium]